MYLVVFRNRKRTAIDQAEYGAEADRMEAMARQQPGFLSFKSYTSDDGEVIALSEWEDESSAHGWGKQAEHRLVQAKGRKSYYADYTLYACNNPRTHTFTAKDEQ